jgi:hypothetical protein
MEQNCGPLAVEIVRGKHCDFSNYLSKRARAQSGACAEVRFPDYGTVLWSPGSRNVSRKHCDFSTYDAKKRELSLAHAQRCSFLIMEHSCCPLAVENFQESTAISALILPIMQELSLALSQRCSFLII